MAHAAGGGGILGALAATIEDAQYYCAYSSGSDESGQGTSAEPWSTLDKALQYLRDNSPVILNTVRIRIMEMETITASPDFSGIFVLGDLIIEGHDGTNSLYQSGTVASAETSSTTVNLASGDVPADDIYNGGRFFIVYGTNKGVADSIADSTNSGDTITLDSAHDSATDDIYAVVGSAGLTWTGGGMMTIAPTLGKITMYGLQLINIRLAAVPAITELKYLYWNNDGYQGVLYPGVLGVPMPGATINVLYAHLVSNTGTYCVNVASPLQVVFYYNLTSGGHGINAGGNAYVTCYKSYLSHSGKTAIAVQTGGKVFDNQTTNSYAGTITDASYGWTDFA